MSLDLESLGSVLHIEMLVPATSVRHFFYLEEQSPSRAMHDEQVDDVCERVRKREPHLLNQPLVPTSGRPATS